MQILILVVFIFFTRSFNNFVVYSGRVYNVTTYFTAQRFSVEQLNGLVLFTYYYNNGRWLPYFKFS